MFYNNIRRAKHCRIPDEKKKSLNGFLFNGTRRQVRKQTQRKGIKTLTPK